MMNASGYGSSPYIVVGVGSGLTAVAAVHGGADALAVYSTATYRVRGLPTALSFLPYENCNQVAFDALAEVMRALPQENRPPVIVGLGAHNPVENLSDLIRKARDLGADGVLNEPFISIYGEEIASTMERAGLGFGRETRMLEMAGEMGLATFGWAFNADQAATLAEIGVDTVGAMAGISRNANTIDLEKEIKRLSDICDAAKARNGSCRVLGHGGPFTSPETIGKLLAQTELDGFATGSNIEREIVHHAVCEAVSALKRSF